MITPNIINIDDNIPIYIFWHIFLDKKRYEKGKKIIERQFSKIINSGLYDRCKNIYICYVAEIDFPCQDIINHEKVKIIKTQHSGHEGVTTTELKKFCDNQTNNNLILYIHNRGITHEEGSATDSWTEMMEYFVIERWKYSIQMLKDKFTCGCELWCHTYQRIPKYNFYFHYSGNFWWSRSDYIKLLEYPEIGNRHTESEDWILLKLGRGIEKEYFGILHRTSLNRYERGMVYSYTDYYPRKYYESGSETPDIEIDRSIFHGQHCYGK